MPGSRVVLPLLALFAVVILASPLTFGIAGVPGASPPDAITESGDAINRIYWVVYALAAGVFILIELALIVFIFRFRRRRPGAAPDAEGPQIHGNTRIEIIWTAIPVLLLLGLSIYMFTQVPQVEAKPAADEDVVEIQVTGHQFYWQYEYPNGALSFDELVLPVDRKVTLVLNSPDVNHSWWVPELTGKRDAIPGQTNRLSFTPRKTGTLEGGVCGEYCGIEHAKMTFSVEVVEEADFETYLEENAPEDGDDALVALGEDQWAAACAKCHGMGGEGGIGPPIAQNNTLVDRENLTELLYEGQNLPNREYYMPPVGRGWSDRQVEALIAYVRSNERLAPQEGDDGR